jgi:hypothetical protein
MDSQSTAKEDSFEGEMYLYAQPELLTPEDHGDLGLITPKDTYGFARSVRAIPIAASEISSAAKHYPVIFSSIDSPALLAVLGIQERNLFVDESGTWESNRYVPAYFRCYPFALASSEDKQLAVVIDRAASCVSDSPEIRFYEGKELSTAIKDSVDLCVTFTGHRRQTIAFCERLKELDLLVPRQITQRGKESPEESMVAAFAAVDGEKVKQLDDKLVAELNANGMLPAIYAHLSSLENWNYLINRNEVLLQSEQDPEN